MNTSPRGPRVRPNGPMHLRLVSAACLVLAVAACSAAPRPTTTAAAAAPTPSVTRSLVTPRPIATDSPRPAVSAAPFEAGPAWEPFGEPIEYERGRTTATTTRQGVRISLSADATSFSSPAGLWLTTRLENRGDDVLHWVTDGCGINVGVEARTGVDWTYGAEQPSTFKLFKDWLLERYAGSDRYAIHLRVSPDWALDKEDFGCADLGLGHDLEPGGRLTARHFVKASTGTWSGTYGLPPAGPVLITGTFGTWWRGDEDMDTTHHDALVASLVVLLEEGRDPALISPGQAVDVALQAPALQQLVNRYPTVPDFAPLEISFDTTTNRWTIHVVFGSRTTSPKPFTIVVDARTATVVEVLNPYPLEPAPCACPSP